MWIPLRDYRRASRFKNRLHAERIITTADVLHDDVNGLCAGIGPDSISRTALPEAPLGKRGCTALRCMHHFPGKTPDDVLHLRIELRVTGLIARDLTNGILRKKANAAVFTAVEKHLVPDEHVPGR